MLGDTCGKPLPNVRKSTIYSRLGRTVLEKILIAAAAFLFIMCVFFAILYFAGRKEAYQLPMLTTVSTQEDTAADSSGETDAETTPAPTGSDATESGTTESAAVTSADTTAAAAITPAATVTPAVTTASTAAPSVVNTANMYSSYAFMKSFDPITGWARFDYFDMLRGTDAVNWLVANEGYTQADAQALVDDFADSEFITKNVNPQLRTADMNTSAITMMYHPDGTQVDDATPVSLTYNKFKTLYASYPDKVLNSFFYYVTVEGGVITEVEQVYWP